MNNRFLELLWEKIKDVSVNELTAVYPEEIIEWIGATNEEAMEIIAWLLRERLITERYYFKCDCGRSCTLYSRKLDVETQYICPECEKRYYPGEIKSRGVLLYEIEKESVLECIEKKTDFKKLTNNVVKIEKLERECNEHMGDGKSIFIGSSSNEAAKEKMREIAIILETLGYDARRWDDKSNPVFVPGQYTYDSLINIANETDGAIFIFNSDDEVWCDRDSDSVYKVRDNVLLEYGLFTGVHGKNSVCFVVTGKQSIASDLQGITYIDGSSKKNILEEQIRVWIDKL